MNQFWITFLSIAAGAVGYLIATFWVRPILRYRDIKYQASADLVFFANAIELQKQDGTLRDDTLARKEANRRCAADLKAIYYHLPSWYQHWLKQRNEDPTEASSALIGLSNVSNRNEANAYIEDVRTHLKLPVGRL